MPEVERVNRHQRAVALLAVDAGKTLTDAAKEAGWKVHDTVTRLIRRFNERGQGRLDPIRIVTLFSIIERCHHRRHPSFEASTLDHARSEPSRLLHDLALV